MSKLMLTGHKAIFSGWLLYTCLELVCMINFTLRAQTTKNWIDPVRQKIILTQIDNLLENKYVLPDSAVSFAREFKQRADRGRYDACANAREFAEKINNDLLEICHDHHIKFRIVEPSNIGENTESALHHPIRLRELRDKENFGFHKLEWLENRIGYLDLRRFYSLAEAQDMAIAAMRFLARADAIIIDLRENPGGSGESLPFYFSYFFKDPVQLTGYYSREDDFLTEFWTSATREGEGLFDVPLFVVTSKTTFSAAEAFAYDMQVRKRATIIGEPTGGGANSVDLYPIDDGFEIYIPTARAVNPLTGTNWEGSGVVPDIIVPASTALDTAIARAIPAAQDYAQQKQDKLKLTIDKMQINLQRAEELYREDQISHAEVLLDSMLQLARTEGLINEFFMNILAYAYLSNSNEKMLMAILHKNVEFFPESSTAYESLAYAYFKNGYKDQALRYYKKVIDLDPDNRNARKMIRRLQMD